MTPSYNQGAFIERTLRSVILQGYPNLEYIVIDGGSTDGSAAIIRRHEPWLTYWHSRRDHGQAAAIAEGFRRSTGDILCWLNSDDILLPGALEHVATLFIRNPRVDFIYGNRLVIDEQDRVIAHHVWPRFLTRWHWAAGQPLAQECCYWRRGLYQSVGGIDEQKFFILDYDLFFRMWRAGRFRKTPRFLGCYREHELTKTSMHDDVRGREAEAARSEFGLRAAGYLLARVLGRIDGLISREERRSAPEHYPRGARL